MIKRFYGFDRRARRAYYMERGRVYCIQNESAQGRPAFKFYACWAAGEPREEAASPFKDIAAEYARREKENDQ